MDKIHNVKECQELAHTTDMDSKTRKTLRETYPKSQDGVKNHFLAPKDTEFTKKNV